jgi:hypothetical protein
MQLHQVNLEDIDECDDILHRKASVLNIFTASLLKYVLTNSAKQVLEKMKVIYCNLFFTGLDYMCNIRGY